MRQNIKYDIVIIIRMIRNPKFLANNSFNDKELSIFITDEK